MPWLFRPFTRGALAGGRTGNWLTPFRRWFAFDCDRMAAEATEAVAQTTVGEFLDFVLALVLDLERLPPGELRHSWFEEAGRVLANRDYDRHSLTPRL